MLGHHKERFLLFSTISFSGPNYMEKTKGVLLNTTFKYGLGINLQKSKIKIL